MINIRSGLPRSPEQRKEHIKKLIEVYECEQHGALFDALYSNLTILDDKASALLSFNSIMVAISSIYLVNQTDFLHRLPFVASILFLFASCVLCMKIIWLYWSSSDDLVDMEQHATLLLTIRYKRTVTFRMAWLFAMLSILLLAFSIPLLELLG